MNAEENTGLTLYTYWRSSAAYRVRIALNLKGLTFKSIPVHLVRQGGEQRGEAFRSLNPQGLVPVLLHEGNVLTQSMAICEYLDERFDEYLLLPTDPLERARVRSMALQIACDIHPLNNLRVLQYLKAHSTGTWDTAAWMAHWMTEGFSAIEQQLADRPDSDSGFCSDRAGLFECFLVPQVYNAERYATDLSAFPRIRQLVGKCRQLSAFSRAAPEKQPDADQI